MLVFPWATGRREDRSYGTGVNIDKRLEEEQQKELALEKQYEKEKFYTGERIGQSQSRVKTDKYTTKTSDDLMVAYQKTNPQYRSLTGPIDRVVKYFGEAYLLNAILRTPGMRHPDGLVLNFTGKNTPTATAAKNFRANQINDKKQEEDHFIEIQHAVDMIITVYGGTFTFSEPIGSFLDLAQYINDPRNTYALASTNNQLKKEIPVRSYLDSPFMQEYLEAGTKVRQTGLNGKDVWIDTTVKAQVASLIRDMLKERQYSRLTNAVARELCIIFNMIKQA
ncbi:hypothetical protein BDW22DRAFT_1429674 [Trametopsis cervina]|nr:hypothetical protein BDW22DRAFT_1429674 [Trametopsis cervina]